MIKRRTFLTATSGAALAATVTSSLSRAQADHHGGHQQTLEWRKWTIETKGQRQLVDRFLKNAAIPALNRQGCKPIGVFYDLDNADDLSIYMLTPFKSLAAFTGAQEALGQDSNFMENAYEYLQTSKQEPGYQRIETTLMTAFAEFPTVQVPLSGERIFELRVYESHNELKGVLKVEMFNEAELDIFEKIDLKSVFYGQAIAGANLPNLTYMVAYKNREERKAVWGRFGKHPDWQVLKNNERYKDTVSNIRATFLKPAPYSQI